MNSSLLNFSICSLKALGSAALFAAQLGLWHHIAFASSLAPDEDGIVHPSAEDFLKDNQAETLISPLFQIVGSIPTHQIGGFKNQTVRTQLIDPRDPNSAREYVANESLQLQLTPFRTLNRIRAQSSQLNPCELPNQTLILKSSGQPIERESGRATSGLNQKEWVWPMVGQVAPARSKKTNANTESEAAHLRDRRYFIELTQGQVRVVGYADRSGTRYTCRSAAIRMNQPIRFNQVWLDRKLDSHMTDPTFLRELERSNPLEGLKNPARTQVQPAAPIGVTKPLVQRPVR